MELTQASQNLLTKIVTVANDCGSTCPWHEWLGEPLTQQEKGNLTDLVKKGFIKVGEDSGQIYYDISDEAFELIENLSNDEAAANTEIECPDCKTKTVVGHLEWTALNCPNCETFHDLAAWLNNAEEAK
jgi:hypothetical protein